MSTKGKKNVNIVISPDESLARISIRSKGKNYPTKSEILTSIKNAGVVFGVDSDLIDKLVQNNKPVSLEPCADGRPLQKGENAKLVWYIDLSATQKPAITDDGKANFKQLNKFTEVKKGQELVAKLPFTQGVSGKTVTGVETLLPGDDIPMPIGKNTELSDDGLTIISSIDGYAFWESGEIYIDNVYQIDGDVDFSTGNISFDGSIYISGDVRSGFRVDATESIYIEGNVEASHIYAEKGNVNIKRGIIGKKKAKILTGGSLLCGFIQEATVAAKNDIIIDHYAFNSNLSSRGNIIANNEGIIRGGKIIARDSIVANEIGSIHNKATELGINKYDKNEVHVNKVKKKDKLEELKQKRNTLGKKIEFLKLMKDRFKTLSEEKKQLLIDIQKQHVKITNTIKNTKIELADLVNSHSVSYDSESIIIKEKLYKGVTIKIGHLHYFTEKMFRKVKVYIDEDKIVIGSL